MKKILFLFFIAYAIPAFSFQQDSINNDLSNRVKLIEDHQKNVDGASTNKFNKLSQDLSSEYNLIKRLGYIGIGINVLFIFGLLYKGLKHMNKRIEEEIEKNIIENKKAIKEAINKQHVENNIVDSKRILVLTSQNGDDAFLKKFFAGMNFPKSNLVFEKGAASLQQIKDGYLKKYDLIFANNENGNLDFKDIHSYFQYSDPATVLFYFGSENYYPEEDEVKNRLSFAKVRTQIFGNLINLFRFQEILQAKPKILV